MSLILFLCIISSLIIPGSAFTQNNDELLWMPSNKGFNAGLITDLALDENQNTLWASSIRGGIFRNTNNSQIWETANKGLSNLYVHSLMFSPAGLFAGTDDFIFVWHNATMTWQAIDPELKQISVNNLCWIDYKGAIILLASTNKGLFRSEDRGTSWQKLLIGSQNYTINSFAKANNREGYVLASATGRWILASEDAGKTWKKVNEQPLITEAQTLHIDIDNNNIWYAGTAQQGFLQTSDNGQNWSHQNKNLDNIYVSKILQDPISKNLWISTFDGLFFSRPNIVDWNSFEKLPFNNQLNTFLINYKTNTVFAGTHGDSVYYSNLTEKKWLNLNENMHNAHVRVVRSSRDGRYLYSATWGSGIYRSSDGGRSWKAINHGITNPLILCIEDNGKGDLYAGTYNGGLFRSRNAGESWDRIEAPTLFSKYIYSIAFDPLDSKRIYIGTQEGVYRSVSDGESWSNMGPGTRDQPVGNITSIAISPKNNLQIIVATDASGAYISSDGSDTWNTASAGLSNNNLSSIVYHPDANNIIYASSFGGGVFRSTDNAASWHEMNENLNNMKAYSLFIEKTRPEVLYVSTENGLFHTLPGSRQWELFGAGLTGKPVRDVFIDTRKNIFVAGTYGNGCFLLYQMPPPPQLLEPKNDSEIITLRPTLVWKEPLYYLEPVFYTIQFSLQEDFKTVIFEQKGLSGDQFVIPRDLLVKHKTYFWRVRSEIRAGGGRWSDSFRLNIVTIIVLRINQPMMTVDRIELEVDPGRGTVPIIRNNRTFLPIRTVVESVGGSIDWDENTRTVRIKLHNTTIELIIDKAQARINGQEVLIDPADKQVTPFIQNARTMLPLRFVGESLNMRIDWEGTTQTINMVYPDKKNG